jgi:outer membrane cobalamin receptor
MQIGEATSISRASWQRSTLNYQNISRETDDTGVSNVLKVEQEIFALVRSMQVSGGLSLTHTDAVHPAYQKAEDENAIAAFASMSTGLGSSVLTASVREDVYKSSDGGVAHIISPRAGINAPLSKGKTVRLKSSLGKSSTMPTFNDRFWSGVGAKGNRYLKPETGWSFDGGFVTEQARISAEASGFVSRVKDQIEWRPDSDGIWVPDNIGKVINKGIETSVRMDLVQSHIRSTFSLGYNFVSARDRTDPQSATYKKQLRYIPMHSGSFAANVQARGYTLATQGHFAGKRFVTSDESLPLSQYASVSVNLTREVDFNGGVIRASVDIDNIFNSSFVQVQGYPMPLRNYTIGLTITL